MHWSFNKSFKLASVYGGVVLGAGFASGQELLKFFVRYGYSGLIGLLISGAIFYFVGFAVMDICISKNIRTYSGFMEKIMGKRLGLIMEIIVVIFLAALFTTMLAAGGAALNQAFGINYLWGVTLMAVFCFITFLFDVKGIIEINVALVPVLVIGGAGIGLFTAFSGRDAIDFSVDSVDSSWDFVKSAFLYASYNIITAVTVLCTLRDEAKDKKTAKYGMAIGGAAMTALGVCLAIPLYIYKDSASYEIPFMYITGQFGRGLEYFYLLVLLTAIFTSAISNGFAIINFFKERFAVKPIPIKIIICLLGILLGQIGFSSFVGTVYPIFGYVGLIEIICILIVYIRRK